MPSSSLSALLPSAARNPLAALSEWAAIAALVAALGPLLLRRDAGGPTRSLGWAGALASGAMLGVAYPLMNAGLARAGVLAMVGAVVGIAGGYATHVLLGVGMSETVVHPARATATSALHSAPEGIAMGAAMTIAPRFGFFLVATLAVHNIWESAVLASCLEQANVSRSRAAIYGVATNAPQVLMAIGAFLLAAAVPLALPLLLGVSFGALVYLCLAELLPDSYRTAGRTSIAVVVSVAAGVVALLGGVA
ncbi:MAG TPA: ZIP family metal transporter [Gemmatimonadaceae bacterium]